VLDEENILSVLATAFALELESLCDVCIALLPNIVTPRLFLELHAFKKSWNGKEYSSLITDILERYLNRTAFVELRSSLHRFPRDELQRLFSSDVLWVPSEFDRFQLVMEVYQQMKQKSEEETKSKDQRMQLEPKRSLQLLTSRKSVPPDVSGSRQLGRSVSSYQPALSYSDGGFHAMRVNSAPEHSCYDPNNCKLGLSASDCEFLEDALSDENVYYPCFSFADLTIARSQAQSMGLIKIVRAIEKSLWTKSTVHGMIISEASRHGDLRSSPTLPKSASLDMAEIAIPPNDSFAPVFRYSTEIKDVEAFRHTRDFTSDDFYFCGSLYRVVLTIRYDESSQDHLIGMFLQRSIISNMDSWQFCDPRSSVDVHVEFIAGTRQVEMIVLDGKLEVPHYNKGYSRFLYVSELPKYLSPSGSLRITTVLKLTFDNNDGHGSQRS